MEPLQSSPKPRPRILIAGIALAGITLLGLNWYARHTASWTEEVMLSDRRMVTIERTSTFNSEHRFLRSIIRFDLPETGGATEWNQQLVPVLLDVHQGKAYMVGRVTYVSATQYQHPRYGYVAFLFGQGSWHRVPFLSLPDAIRQAENIPWCDDAGEHRKWIAKQQGWCDSDGDFVLGRNRSIDLTKRARNAQDRAELANTTTRSE